MSPWRAHPRQPSRREEEVNIIEMVGRKTLRIKGGGTSHWQWRNVPLTGYLAAENTFDVGF